MTENVDRNKRWMKILDDVYIENVRIRNDVLAEAKDAINGKRDEQYGTPEANLERIAKLWTVLFGQDVSPWQVALAMDLVKTARLMNDPEHFDGWVDKAGYAAIGYEVIYKKGEDNEEA